MATNTNFSSLIPTVKTRTGTTIGNGGIPVLPADFASPETGMFEVKLTRIVTINNVTYSPRHRNVVTKDVKDAMGDAVLNAKQL